MAALFRGERVIFDRDPEDIAGRAGMCDKFGEGGGTIEDKLFCRRAVTGHKHRDAPLRQLAFLFGVRPLPDPADEIDPQFNAHHRTRWLI